MNDIRRVSAKSKGDSINDFPLFQYNTSIIDLKLFPKDQDQDSSYSYDNLNYGNEIQPAYINPKKYLINKNFRFYQPVKDATMLAQLDSLRMKLQASASNKTNDNPNTRPIHSSSIRNNNNNFNEQHSNDPYSCKNCFTCKEEQQRQYDYMKLIQSEILRGKGSQNDNYSVKSINLSSCTKKSPNQSPDIDFYTNIMPNQEAETKKLVAVKKFENNYHQSHTTTTDANGGSDFPELKKYSSKTQSKNAKSRIKSSIYSSREKSATDKPSIPKPKTLLTNLLPTPEISSVTINLLKNKNVQKTVRKSTVSRLKNIYKSNDSDIRELLEIRSSIKTPKPDYTGFQDTNRTPVISYMDIHAPTLISFIDIKDTNSDSKSLSSKINPIFQPIIKSSKHYQNTVILNGLVDFESENKKGAFQPNRLRIKSKSNFNDLISNKIALKT